MKKYDVSEVCGIKQFLLILMAKASVRFSDLKQAVDELDPLMNNGGPHKEK